jgi:hypothetical protein
MFKINYRITDSQEKLKNFSHQEIESGEPIEGYFELEINDKKYGYCNKGILQPGEEGMDLLTTWFESLLELLIEFKNGNNYVAINDTESYNTWLEFKRLDNEHVCISSIRAKKWDGLGQITKTPLEGIESYEWANEIVTFNEMSQEIKNKVNEYITQVGQINEAIVKGRAFTNLKNRLL